MAGSCAGIPTGALPDLAEPRIIPPPQCPSVTLIIKDNQRFYQFSEADALAIAKHREELAGEIIKGRDGMRAYRELLQKCLGRR